MAAANKNSIRELISGADWEEAIDRNNNSNNNNNRDYDNNHCNSSVHSDSSNSDGKLNYEMPTDYEYVVHECICGRPPKAFECGNCHHYFHGRISQHCKVHPLDLFLMDHPQCPYCLANPEMIRESNLSWAQIRKFEDAPLPSDGDDL